MNDLESRVLRLIGENVSSPDVFTDDDEGMAPVRDSISEAISEINMLTGGYTETYSIPLVSNKTFYRLFFERASFGWVQDAWLFGNKRRLTQTSLRKLNTEYPRWTESTGTPESYFHVGHNIIGIFRKPSSSTDVLEITAAVIPGNYQDGERLKLRQAYEQAAVSHAVAEYWAGRGDAQEASKHFRNYAETLGLLEVRPASQERMFTQRTEKHASQ